ncbi:di-trans,poly-cis-decaprenylcistransferase [Candidatus Azambacteria bacterium]|nr:di-trans,poly-cis-decaprenylcistransferase [Candidatus Azambacteria bacterium]
MADQTKIQHLGIIMDGNRRWARSRGLSPSEGHRAGCEKAKEVLKWCREAEIKILTLYAFSTENWRRAKSEVNFLMNIFYRILTKDIKELHKNNVRVRIVGRKEDFSEKLQKAIEESEKLTENNTGIILNLAINYGGRQEIVDAFNKIMENPPKKITENIISQNIYTAGLPDPNLIIRTSGEMRLSGFLMWQSVYSELRFVKRHWPDFSKKDFNDALADFANRQRRFGK